MDRWIRTGWPSGSRMFVSHLILQPHLSRRLTSRVRYRSGLPFSIFPLDLAPHGRTRPLSPNGKLSFRRRGGDSYLCLAPVCALVIRPIGKRATRRRDADCSDSTFRRGGGQKLSHCRRSSQRGGNPSSQAQWSAARRSHNHESLSDCLSRHHIEENLSVAAVPPLSLPLWKPATVAASGPRKQQGDICSRIETSRESEREEPIQRRADGLTATGLQGADA